jgi:hypothetical protein
MRSQLTVVSTRHAAILETAGRHEWLVRGRTLFVTA